MKTQEATKKIKLCPSCRSDNILSIAEKKSTFIKHVRDSVVKLRLGYEELSNFINRIDKIKNVVFKLRTNGYLHEFSIEKTVFELLNTIPIIKDKVMLKIKQDYELLKHQLKNFSNFHTITPQRFPAIDASLEQVIETAVSHAKFLDETFNPLSKKLNIISEKLKAINFFKKIFDEYKENLILLPGELPVCAFKNIKFKKFSGSDIDSSKGTLFFTDRRIIFYIKKGFIFKKAEKLFGFIFEGLESVTIKGRFFKRIHFLLEDGELVFSGKGEILKAISSYFNIAINFEKYRVSEKVATKLSVKNLENLLNLKNQIETYITNLLNFQTTHPQDSYYRPSNRQEYVPNTRQVNNELFRNLRGATSNQNQPRNAGMSMFDTEPNSNDTLLKYEQDKIRLENTMANLERQYNNGFIPSEDFLNSYRINQDVLINLKVKINELKKNKQNQELQNRILNYRPNIQRFQ